MSLLRDKLHDAMLVLTSHENAKSRLTKAWVDRLELVPTDEVPETIRDRFLAMRDRIMARRPVNNENPIVATIRKMSPLEASDCGRDIVQLYFQIMTDAAPVQLRLVETPVEEAASRDEIPDFLTQH
ncbi:MAG: hypothetical protein AAFR91_06620 [Pseudomonadota bacterium]